MKNEKRSLSAGFLFIFPILLVTTWTVCASEGVNFGPQTINGEPLWRLISATDALNSNFSKIENALVDASLALSETGIDGPAVRTVLSNLTRVDTAVIDCITIDPKGIVHEVEPVSFRNIKGMNLKSQKQVNDTINTKLYSGFYLIQAVEGMHAIDSEMPIFNKNGTFLGTVSLIFNNTQFFGRILAPFQISGNSKIWVSKANDATILYETDPSQILLNRSSSIYQSYQSLLKIADRMSVERTGYGTYEFLDQSHNKTIKKGCYWTTIPNEGAEMRVILTLELD